MDVVRRYGANGGNASMKYRKATGARLPGLA